MTPLELWSIGSEGFIWIRFISKPIVLIVLGLSSLSFVFLMNKLSPELKAYLIWFKKDKVKGIITGVLGALAVALPFVIYQISSVPINERGGIVPGYIVPFILFITLTGNLFEEVLFRGYFQGLLEKKYKINIYKAGLISGVLFSFGHIFLAYNITNVGLPILIFALWEGSIAGLVRARYGIVPAVFTHGLAVFILSSGLF